LFGLHDFWTGLSIILCIASTLLCVIYGALNWNRGGEETVNSEKVLHWEEAEEEIED